MLIFTLCAIDETFIQELNDDLQKSRRQIDLYREKASTQEHIKRDMEYDMEEMHRLVPIE